MKYQVMPDLTPLEYEALKADIAKAGKVLVAVEFDEAGAILDGHHRVRAWEELRQEGYDLPDYPRIVRRGLSEQEKRNHARRLNTLRRHLTREQRDELMCQMRADGATYQEIASAAGVSTMTAYRATSELTNDNSEVINTRGQTRPASYNRQPDDAGHQYAASIPIQLEDDSVAPPAHYATTDQWGSTQTVTVAPDDDTSATRRPHVANNSGNNEWYTPQEYIAAARRVMGWIDLDPASSHQANLTVGASRYYTAEDDGLQQHWAGQVWMNPPYAAGLVDRFCAKYANHVRAGDIEQGIVLVNNATETRWFAALVDAGSAVIFPQSRIRFWSPDGAGAAPLQGQAIIYSGPNVAAFLGEFARFGWGARL